MKRIFKYDVGIGQYVQHQMPEGAEIVHVDVQFARETDVVTFWAIVDTDRTLETRTFVLAGTGMGIEDGMVYRGTGKAADGALMWHLFELPREVVERKTEDA